MKEINQYILEKFRIHSNTSGKNYIQEIISEIEKYLLSIGIKNKYYSISKREYVLSNYNEPVHNMPIVITDKVECRIGEKIRFKDDKTKETVDKLLAEFEEKKISVNYIDITDGNNIVAGVMDRFKVLFGSSAYLENKCLHLSGMVRNINENEKGTINLTMWTAEKSEGTFIKDTDSGE